jgi:hypothetical protein
MVVHHVVLLNAAASLRAKRYSPVESKTPEIGTTLALDLMERIATLLSPSSGPK